MALKRDLSDVPMATRPEGRKPSPPRIMPLIMTEWNIRDAPNRDRPMAFDDARIRHSWAGHCSRRLGYEIAGEPATDPPSMAGLWSMALGTVVHEFWQGLLHPALEKANWTEIECEAKARVEADGLVSAAHLDARAVSPKRQRVAFELKSINGFGFKNIVGAGSDPPGPRTGDVLQGAVNAAAVDADWLQLCYVAMESMSESYAKRAGIDDEFGRFTAEWLYSREEYAPLADQERGRWLDIAAQVDAGLAPPRKIIDPAIPDDAVVTDPATGRWESITPDGLVAGAGRTWHCGYCSHQTLCQNSP